MQNRSAWRVGHRGLSRSFVTPPLLQIETVLPAGLSPCWLRGGRALTALGPEPSWKSAPRVKECRAPARAPGALMRVTRRCRVGNTECQSGCSYKSSRIQVEIGIASGKRCRSPAWLSVDPARVFPLGQDHRTQGAPVPFCTGKWGLGLNTLGSPWDPLAPFQREVRKSNSLAGVGNGSSCPSS